jgi:hypothetical protein
MPDPMQPEFTAQNPIVAAAERIRARRRLDEALQNEGSGAERAVADDAEASLRLLGRRLADGVKRINLVFGERNGVKLVVLQRPLRMRLRMQDRRVALDLDDRHQLVRIAGLELDGEYQFDPAPGVPALINLSKISTEAGYGERLTASSLLQRVVADARRSP